MGDIKNKVAIVTGAGRGIGKAFALTYARAGAHVVVASRTQSTVDAVVNQIRNEGGSGLGVTCDVGEKSQVLNMVAQAAEAFGTVDILVNNAQSFGTREKPLSSIPLIPLEDWDDDGWEHIHRTGLLATLWGMQAAFPYMKDRGGKIINFGSNAGFYGMAGSAAYNCTKEAIRALTRTAAREWGKYRINVNVVAPVLASEGHEVWEKEEPGKLAEILSTIPLGRFGDPTRDGGPLALFLASSDSDFITGQTLQLDGGLFLAP